MSDFDLKLDRWSKLSNVVISALGIFFAGYVFFALQKPAHDINLEDKCLGWLEKTTKQNKNGSPELQAKAQKAMNKHCPKEEEMKQALIISNTSLAQKAKIVQLEEKLKDLNVDVAPKASTDDGKVHGYVSLGPAAKGRYPESNFRNLKIDEKALKYHDKLKKGTILIARWSVNLRKNKLNTELGQNPSIAIINDNECVEMEEDLPEPTRNSYWVKVTLSACN